MNPAFLTVMFFAFGLCFVSTVASQDETKPAPARNQDNPFADPRYSGNPFAEKGPGRNAVTGQEADSGLPGTIQELTRAEHQAELSKVQAAIFRSESELANLEKTIAAQNTELRELALKYGAKHPRFLEATAKITSMDLEKSTLELSISNLNRKLAYLISPNSRIVEARLSQATLELSAARTALGENHPNILRLRAVQKELAELAKRTGDEELKLLELETIQFRIMELSQAIEKLERAVAGLSPERIQVLKNQSEQYQSLKSEVERVSESANSFVTGIESELKEMDRTNTENDGQRMADLAKQAELLQSQGTAVLNAVMAQLSPSERLSPSSGAGVIYTFEAGNIISERLNKMESRLDSMESLLKEIAAGLPKAGEKK